MVSVAFAICTSRVAMQKIEYLNFFDKAAFICVSLTIVGGFGIQ